MAENQEVVIVGGCGHVGLTLGIVLATRRAAAAVTLLDVDAGKVESVNNGRMPFMEAGADGLKQVAGKTLRATLDIGCLRTADIVITVVGTPVDEHLNPTVTAL